MHTITHLFLGQDATVSGRIGVHADGRRYLILKISDNKDGVMDVSIFPRDPEFLDKLSNECDRLCREFVGDVPPPLEIGGTAPVGVGPGVLHNGPDVE